MCAIYFQTKHYRGILKAKFSSICFSERIISYIVFLTEKYIYYIL